MNATPPLRVARFVQPPTRREALYIYICIDIYREDNYVSPNEALEHCKARDVENQRLHCLHMQLGDSS